MKYKPEDYLDTNFYPGDEDVLNHQEKVVKCRKPHQCVSCDKEITKGDYALRETGFLDNEPVSSYTCLPCIEEWLEESGQVETEEEVSNEEK